VACCELYDERNVLLVLYATSALTLGQYRVGKAFTFHVIEINRRGRLKPFVDLLISSLEIRNIVNTDRE
jgi:hypothetical protein